MNLSIFALQYAFLQTTFILSIDKVRVKKQICQNRFVKKGHFDIFAKTNSSERTFSFGLDFNENPFTIRYFWVLTSFF